MTANVKKAMLLSAGLGMRMRPLTETRPKPLVEFDGKALIDHALDRLEEAGIEEVVVNVHYLADQLEDHLKTRSSPNIVISDERDALLDTGGGVKKALPLLGEDPILTFNSDSVWVEGMGSNLRELIEAFDPERMDALLMIADAVRTIGYCGKGDFEMDPDGRLSRREESRTAPYMFAGVQVIKPQLFVDGPEGAFSTNRIWDALIEKGTLFGRRMGGLWMHVGAPDDLQDAEAALKEL